MNRFFTSDHHFGHANIIKLCNRPFKTLHEMNEEMIARWNSEVGVNDEVYHVGDISLCNSKLTNEILYALHGKIYLINGNHDKTARDNKVKGRFGWIKDYHELTIDGVKIILCHYAFRVWNKSHHGSWHLYGHSHGTLPDDPCARSMDVGVDPNNFTPLSYDDIKVKMMAKKFIPVDHHNGERA